MCIRIRVRHHRVTFDADFVSLKASLIKIFAARLRIKEGYIFARTGRCEPNCELSELNQQQPGWLVAACASTGEVSKIHQPYWALDL